MSMIKLRDGHCYTKLCQNSTLNSKRDFISFFSLFQSIKTWFSKFSVCLMLSLKAREHNNCTGYAMENLSSNQRIFIGSQAKKSLIKLTPRFKYLSLLLYLFTFVKHSLFVHLNHNFTVHFILLVTIIFFIFCI